MQLGNGPASGRCMITETQLACYGEAGPTHYLMSLYELQQDGRLTGIWTHSGLSGFGQEVLTPQ